MIFTLLCLLASVLAVFSSTVSVSEPLVNQLPVIARVGKPYSWTASPKTFNSPNVILNYTTSTLPAWLAFDASTLTFHGTPSASDEGNPKITITAHDFKSSASSTATLCVTPYPPPSLQLPISEQFHDSNPSLSSVFLLKPNSALSTPNPSLRIHPKWSFSIGFEGRTFTSENDLYYAALQADGTSIPDWMTFDPDSITLNGVAPHEETIISPLKISLNLHASDQEGYSALSEPFDIIIASHELSRSTKSLPTMNTTASTPFSISLNSPSDLWGVLMDGLPIQPSNLTSLAIDVSEYKWLQYNAETRTLSGNPGSDVHVSPVLPVTLETSFNQSLQTNVALALVPPYFTMPLLPQYQTPEDRQVHVNFVQYYSNATTGNVNLGATFIPPESSDWLSFDPGTGQLSGSIPEDFNADIAITLTAYSPDTHSTSHTTLPISVSPSVGNKSTLPHTNALAAAKHTKLVLGLAITFGTIGGLCVVGGLLAAFRRCARVEDTALAGEEGRSAWSEQDRKWYGLDEKEPEENKNAGYGWTERISRDPEKVRHGMDIRNPSELKYPAPTLGGPEYGSIGLGLHRVAERSTSNPLSNVSVAGSKFQSPKVMVKHEFLTRIKETVRRVSYKYAPSRGNSQKRPIIGKPLLLGTQPIDRPSLEVVESDIEFPENPFEGAGIQSHPGSTIMTNSPSASTGERSIPRRRADFAPPKSPALAHFGDGQLERQASTGSNGSLVSEETARAHADEAVVQTASRATSIRSGRSISGASNRSIALDPVPQVVGPRPRLVPFTSATRVPVPRLLHPDDSEHDRLAGINRVASQSAKVWKTSSREEASTDVKKSASGDELSMGLHYVRTLGADRKIAGSNAMTPSVNVRTSLSSLESAHRRYGKTAGGDVMKMLVRAGENFKFRVPVPASTTARKFEAKLISGDPLPKFLHADVNVNKHKGAVEFYGTPTTRDLGEMEVGVYMSNDGGCVARVMVEVVRG